MFYLSSKTLSYKFVVTKTKMVNNRSKLNQFVFHLSNPLTISFRNIILKRIVKKGKKIGKLTLQNEKKHPYKFNKRNMI